MNYLLSKVQTYTDESYTHLFLSRIISSFRIAPIRNITIILALFLLATIIHRTESQPAYTASFTPSHNEARLSFKVAAPVAYANETETEKTIMINKLTDEASKISPTSQPELKANIAGIVDSLSKKDIATPRVIAYALATAERETAQTFKPIEEFGGPQQAIALGYSGGERYYGRGYIQITHDYNYKEMGEKIGMGDALLNNPELALDPKVASDILAEFFKEREVATKAEEDFVAAREPINGSDHAESIALEAEKYLQAIEEAKH